MQQETEKQEQGHSEVKYCEMTKMKYPEKGT
jgi:hypothetical protein